jgi:hypothetical protein
LKILYGTPPAEGWKEKRRKTSEENYLHRYDGAEARDTTWKKEKNKNEASPATPDSQQQIYISINAARVAEPQPTQSIEIFCRQLEIELICFAFQKL